MIEAVESPIPKYIPAAPIRNSNPKKLTWGEEAGDTSSLPRAFLDNLQKVMNKKWQVAEKCQTNMEMTPHKVLGFRTEEPVSKVGQPQWCVRRVPDASGAAVWAGAAGAGDGATAVQPWSAGGVEGA